MILRDDVKGLGKKGDVVDVSEGYGRNYLIPRNLAVPVTEGKIREANLIQESRAKKEAREKKNAEELAARLKGMTVTVAGRAGEGGRLYGAITSRDIAAELEAVLHKPLDRRKIELPEPIKTLGTYPVVIRLYPGVNAEIKVQVIAEQK